MATLQAVLVAIFAIYLIAMLFWVANLPFSGLMDIRDALLDDPWFQKHLQKILQHEKMWFIGMPLLNSCLLGLFITLEWVELVALMTGITFLSWVIVATLRVAKTQMKKIHPFDLFRFH